MTGRRWWPPRRQSPPVPRPVAAPRPVEAYRPSGYSCCDHCRSHNPCPVYGNGHDTPCPNRYCDTGRRRLDGSFDAWAVR